MDKILERFEDQIMVAALHVAADVARRTAESPDEAAREVVKAAKAAAGELAVRSTRVPASFEQSAL